MKKSIKIHKAKEGNQFTRKIKRSIGGQPFRNPPLSFFLFFPFHLFFFLFLFLLNYTSTGLTCVPLPLTLTNFFFRIGRSFEFLKAGKCQKD